jgi:hypothetical protein
MGCIRKLSRLSRIKKEGFYRMLIPPSLYHHFWIDPITFRDGDGEEVARFFCPKGDGTCLVEIKRKLQNDPIYSIQLSDSVDPAQIEWDFVMVNNPDSQCFKTDVDSEGKDTLFGWASRNLPEEEKAMAAGYFPGQTRTGLRLTGEVIKVLEFFCSIFDIKTIRLEALFYHNAVTYERHGFSYFSGYREMKRIHEAFQPGGPLLEKMDRSTPFRDPDLAQTVRGRSWAIHDGILEGIDDDLIGGGWESPTMYRMVGKPRGMITFPDPVY